MNAIPSVLLPPTAVAALCLLLLSCAASQADILDTVWTSNDGAMIRARLAGWDGTRFILIKEGRTHPPGL